MLSLASPEFDQDAYSSLVKASSEGSPYRRRRIWSARGGMTPDPRLE